MSEIRVECGTDFRLHCDQVIVIPARALTEPGYIRVIGVGPGGPDKHGVQALAQTACYRYQDDDLDVAELSGPCRIGMQAGAEQLMAGMIIYRKADGEVGAAAHGGLNRRKLLEAAHRYCTRWVRLDI